MKKYLLVMVFLFSTFMLPAVFAQGTGGGSDFFTGVTPQNTGTGTDVLSQSAAIGSKIIKFVAGLVFIGAFISAAVVIWRALSDSQDSKSGASGFSGAVVISLVAVVIIGIFAATAFGLADKLAALIT